MKGQIITFSLSYSPTTSFTPDVADIIGPHPTSPDPMSSRVPAIGSFQYAEVLTSSVSSLLCLREVKRPWGILVLASKYNLQCCEGAELLCNDKTVNLLR